MADVDATFFNLLVMFWQEIEKVPALMTRAPTQEEIDNNVALSALQALKYEDEDPIGKTKPVITEVVLIRGKDVGIALEVLV